MTILYIDIDDKNMNFIIKQFISKHECRSTHEYLFNT